MDSISCQFVTLFLVNYTSSGTETCTANSSVLLPKIMVRMQYIFMV